MSPYLITGPALISFSIVPSMPVPVDDLPQGFDLGLADYEGNCDLCFLKGRGIKKRILRANPGLGEWWARNETQHKGKQERGWFDRRDSVAGLLAEVRRSPDLFEPIDGGDYDVECGLTCAAGEA